MAERYQAKCRVCGTTDAIGPGWCKLLLYDKDNIKSTEWLCPTHYKEYIANREGPVVTPTRCPDHPRYQGLRKPRVVDCQACEDLWNAQSRDVVVSSSGSGSSKM